jgi:hypothetical protein
MSSRKGKRRKGITRHGGEIRDARGAKHPALRGNLFKKEGKVFPLLFP